MALRAVSSFFRADASQCLAHCDQPNFDKFTATKCNHVFCEVCIREWFSKQQICPSCKNPLPNPVLEPFKDLLARVTYYAAHDHKTLKDRLMLEKIHRITSCQLIREKPKSESSKEKESCSICLDNFPHLYFIIEDKNPANVGRYVHGDCLKTVDQASLMQDFSVHELAKIANQLPWPPPSKPTSPLRAIFLLILLPISVWALAMNSRIYRNNNVILFVLSIPALLIFKMFFLILSGVKKIFTEKSH